MDDDVDLMRDVYMTRDQRQAFDRLQKDAERYRVLRRGNAFVPEEAGVTGGADLDALVDGLPEGYERSPLWR